MKISTEGAWRRHGEAMIELCLEFDNDFGWVNGPRGDYQVRRNAMNDHQKYIIE